MTIQITSMSGDTVHALLPHITAVIIPSLIMAAPKDRDCKILLDGGTVVITVTRDEADRVVQVLNQVGRTPVRNPDGTFSYTYQ